MKRYGMVLRVRPEKLDEYKRLHADVWPGVLKMIRECNIRNYSIYHNDGYLFGYFEYHGKDVETDMAKMAADPTTAVGLVRRLADSDRSSFFLVIGGPPKCFLSR